MSYHDEEVELRREGAVLIRSVQTEDACTIGVNCNGRIIRHVWRGIYGGEIEYIECPNCGAGEQS